MTHSIAIEPFPVTAPAPSVPKGELDTGTIAPSSAFEVFAGKSFVTGAGRDNECAYKSFRIVSLGLG